MLCGVGDTSKSARMPARSWPWGCGDAAKGSVVHRGSARSRGEFAHPHQGAPAVGRSHHPRLTAAAAAACTMKVTCVGVAHVAASESNLWISRPAERGTESPVCARSRRKERADGYGQPEGVKGAATNRPLPSYPICGHLLGVQGVTRAQVALPPLPGAADLVVLRRALGGSQSGSSP